MAKPTAFDEQFVHRIPELLPNVVTHHQHWRESLFFDIHDPNVTDNSDVVFLTMAVFPMLPGCWVSARSRSRMVAAWWSTPMAPSPARMNRSTEAG